MAGWGGARSRRARRRLAESLPMPCWRCGRTVWPDDRWEVGHVADIARFPWLIDDPDNQRPEHRACNRRAAALASTAKRSARARQRAATSRDWL